MKSETVMLRFSVRDTGIGIPAEKMYRLFKEFSQVEDVKMPVMDGFEATKRIRNYELGITNKAQTDDSSSSFVIPIIAMTANAMQGDRELCLEAGMNDYIIKPVSPQALAEMLDKWLPKNNDECESSR